jgi:hypothetical protein
LPHQEAIERHLKEWLGTLFDLTCDFLLYDNNEHILRRAMQSHFAGKTQLSRDSRLDCLPVLIPLVAADDEMRFGDDLAFLRQRGGPYIVGRPKAILKRFERQLAKESWHAAQEGVEVKFVPGSEGDQMFLLVRPPRKRAGPCTSASANVCRRD